jgi:hypothetical protein
MKFGTVNVPDSWLWVAGITVPVVGAALYHHFHADPTDIVTDVQAGPAGPPSMVIVYNGGPNDTIPIPSNLAALWSVQGQLAVNAAKAALVGITRDRVRTTVQLQQGVWI